MSKYPLDTEMQAFVDRCQQHYPNESGALSIEDNRRQYLDLCKAFHKPYPAAVTAHDEQVDGRNGLVPIRIYQNATTTHDTTILYFHGGGFIVGNLDSHDSVCAEICDQTGYRLIAVDYRLAPEFVHPTPLEDCLDVFLQFDKGRTVVVGDSAGGTLAASLCVAQLGQSQQPIGQVLIYPWLGGDLLDLDSYVSNADAPGLTTADILKYRALRSAGEPEWHDPVYYPLALKDFRGLPPCHAFAAEHDPIRDDTPAFVERLQAAGVEAHCDNGEGLIHGYLRARHCSEKVKQSFHRICQSIQKMGHQ